MEKATAKNLVINLSDNFFIYNNSAELVSWEIFGFHTTSGCYMFSDTCFLMAKNDSSWGSFNLSMAEAVETGKRRTVETSKDENNNTVYEEVIKNISFTALTSSGYWTVDTENKALVFGKVQ